MATTEGWASGKTSKRHSVVARSAVEVEMRRGLLVLLLLASRRYALPLGAACAGRRLSSGPGRQWSLALRDSSRGEGRRTEENATGRSAFARL